MDEAAAVRIKSLPHRKRTIFLVCALFTPCGFYSYFPVFVYRTPEHRCQLASKDANVSYTQEQLLHSIPFDNSSGQFDSCHRYANRTFNQSKTNSFNIIPCDNGWRYDTTDKTFIMEKNFVCDRAWIRPFLTAVWLVGMLVGSISNGCLSDRFGRRPVMLSTLYLTGIFLLISTITSNLAVFMICMSLSGATSIAFYICALILAQEMSAESERAVIGIIPNLFFTVGYMFLPLAWFLIADWLWFMRLMGIFPFLFIPYYWLIPESPLWLHNKQRSLNIASKRKESASQMLSDTVEMQTQHDKENHNHAMVKGSVTFLDLVKTPTMLGRILNLIFQWTACLLALITLSLNSSNLASNMYLSCFLSAVLEVPAILFAIGVTKRFGRIRPYFASLLLTSTACFTVAVVSKVSLTGGVASALAGKTFATAACAMVYSLTGDVFPTSLRNTGVGLICALSRFLVAISPFIIHAGETIDRFIPFYVISALCVIASLLSLRLPETHGTRLPETLGDALELKAFTICERFSSKRSGRKYEAPVESNGQ